MAGVVIFLAFGRMGEDRRLKRLEQTLPDALQQISNELATKGSIEAALANVIDTAASPAKEELKLLQSRISFLGVPDALDRTARQLDSKSFSLMSAVLRVGTQQGGNLQGALRDLSVTLIDLERLRRRITTASSGSRYALLVMMVVSPFMPIFTFSSFGNGWSSLQDPTTQRILAIAVALYIGGIFGYFRVIKIRV